MIPQLHNLVLLADLDDIIGAIIALVVPLLWVIRQIFAASKPGEQARKQAAPPPAPPQQAPQPAAAGGQQADPLRSQVEEFLRRAGRAPQQAGRRPAEPQRGGKPARTSEIELLVDENPRERPERRPLAQPLRPVNPPLSSPRQQQQRSAPSRKPRPPRQLEQSPRESVAEHVAESIEAHSRMIAEQTSRLGQRIVEDDHQFDVQLKAKFDHPVGTLTGSAVTAAEQEAAAIRASQTAAAQIAAMLASPDGVRQAIVLNEILRRPSERW